MAENKTKPTRSSVAAFIGALTNQTRREDAEALVKLAEGVSGEKAKMWGPSIVGFGSCHYVYESGREGDMPLFAFSPRKAATVLYVRSGFPGAEALLAKVGKHTSGKGCLYVRRLADVDQKALALLIARSLAATSDNHASGSRRGMEEAPGQ